MSESIDPQLQTMIDNMPDKTGKSLQEWYRVLVGRRTEKHGAMMKLLKGEHSVTHGYANTIALLFRQQAAGGPPGQNGPGGGAVRRPQGGPAADL